MTNLTSESFQSDLIGGFTQISDRIFNTKFMLNPIRLLIMSYLNRHYCYSISELRKLMKIAWGTLNDHIKALSKKGFVEVKQEFVASDDDDSFRPTKTLTITEVGRSEYIEFQRIMNELLDQNN